jgi:hypothetical protein
MNASSKVMHNCVPFLQQLREQALLTDAADATSKDAGAAVGKMRSRESLVQQ